MPKSFSENERAYIKKRLMEEARKCLFQFGIKKTTVDELVRRVNIPKGTFYLFYGSKELLFFDIFCEFHDEMQEKLMARIKAFEGDFNARKLTELLFELYKMTEESFMLKFMTNGELELLIRKLPADIAKSHSLKDDFSMEKLLSVLPNINSINIRAFSGALRGIFLSMLHKHEIGDDVFDDALKIMIYGIVLQLFEGEAL